MQLDGEHFQEFSRLDQLDRLSGKVAALLQLGHQLADRSRDQARIPTGWSAVVSHDTSDMLATSGVTELLACAKGKRKS